MRVHCYYVLSSPPGDPVSSQSCRRGRIQLCPGTQTVPELPHSVSPTRQRHSQSAVVRQSRDNTVVVNERFCDKSEKVFGPSGKVS